MRILKQRSAPDRTCAERVKPFLLLFKLCGLFANDVTAGRLKHCSWPIYGICVFWICLCVSFVCYACYQYVISSMSIKMSVYFITNIMGYISFVADVITAYFSQNHFSKVRKMEYRREWVLIVNHKFMILSPSLSLSLILSLIYIFSTVFWPIGCLWLRSRTNRK